MVYSFCLECTIGHCRLISLSNYLVTTSSFSHHRHRRGWDSEITVGDHNAPGSHSSGETQRTVSHKTENDENWKKNG